MTSHTGGTTARAEAPFLPPDPRLFHFKIRCRNDFREALSVRYAVQNQTDRSTVIVLEQNAFQRVRHALPFLVVRVKCAACIPAVGVLDDDNKGAVVPRERAARRTVVMQHLKQCTLDVAGHALAVALQERIQTNVRPAVTGDLHRAVFLDMVRQDMRLTAMLSFPAMFGLAMVAEEFILLTIHEQWLSSVPLLRILCIGGAFMPLYTLYQNLMISRGRSDIYLWCTVVQIVIQIAIVVAFAKFDMQAMVWAYTAGNIVFIGIWQYFLNKLTGIRTTEIMRDICPFMISAAAVMAAVWPLTAPNIQPMAAADLPLYPCRRSLSCDNATGTCRDSE